MTVAELLARHLDFMATPRRHFFEQLAFFAAGARPPPPPPPLVLSGHAASLTPY